MLCQDLKQNKKYSQERVVPWRKFDFSRLASGPLYFYVGAGLSISAGLVNWNEMACLIWLYLKHYEGVDDKRCPPDEGKDNAKFIQDFVEETKISSKIPILSRDSGDPRGFGRTALLNMMLRYRAPRIALKSDGCEARETQKDDYSKIRPRPGREPSVEDLTLQSLIWRSRCSGVLTSNYDMLLEHAYSLFHHGAALRSYRYNADFLRYLLSNRRFVLKLHGDINDIASMQFDPKQAWEKGAFTKPKPESRGMDLKRIYNAILERGHMVYVGCGFRDETIKELHDFWQLESSRPEYRALPNCRIALIPEKRGSDVDLEGFRDIQFLTVGPDCWHELREFLESVVEARSRVPELGRTCPEASDLHRQIFLSWSVPRPVRRLKTEPWTCRGVKP